MAAINPVILLAKERAQFRFSILASKMLTEAIGTVTQQIAAARSPAEQKTATISRDFLEARGQQFLDQLKNKYRAHMERGMQTMYRDLRPGLRNMSFDSLALVDEKAVVQQMEVERRVLRLREADQNSLGRLNLMIAQIHGESDIRERENPFRPYLMARALHDVLTEMTSTTDVCTMLFDHLSGALASHLPDYFLAIRNVFESNGVRARLVARPSMMSKRERDALAASFREEHAANAVPTPAGFQTTGFQQGALPNTALQPTTLQHAAFASTGFAEKDELTPMPVVVPSDVMGRMLRFMQPQKPDTRNMLEPDEPIADAQTALQDFIWKIFNQSSPGRVPPNPRIPEGAATTPYRADEVVDKSKTQLPLFARLSRMQKELAGVTTQEVAHELATQLNLQASLANEKLSELERVAVDIVATLFSYIGNERSLLRTFRAPILQLQIPFMKAALLTPDLLQQADHPARLLVNRMVTVATGLSSSSPIGKGVRDEIQRVVNSILHNFDENVGIFGDALDGFNRGIQKTLTEADDEAARAISALRLIDGNESLEDDATLQIRNALREHLIGLHADPRINDFILINWSKVLLHVESRDDIDSQPYLAVVPDLLWSVQPVSLAERSRLMRLVLTLVQRIKSGLQLIGMSEEQIRAILDVLVELHTGALRAGQIDKMTPSMSMADLHKQFSSINLFGLGELDTPTIQAPAIPEEQLQAELSKLNVAAHLYFDKEIGSLLNSDTEWLKTLQPGAPMECWLHDSYKPVTLLAYDVRKMFYLFRLRGQSEPPRLLIYSSIALIKALREGSVCISETAPVFDRAIDSLLDTADAT
ncbi:MAG: DUF1631 family protein [Oxalicibacterium faecigallinarum]|uniref:DUF1631 family protein n=1 Tax=Oxalicibacterium faecigallinarum TaxID=573741 RepID=UPI00280852DF|nr:DUF1631 family protein [Oxalicibacterium faecigallinarum]MDQ7970083.1 DUF1631 family protein [Oxalicibacterium faecigallinarum]